MTNIQIPNGSFITIGSCLYSERQKKVVIARNPALRGMTKQSPEIASLRSQ